MGYSNEVRVVPAGLILAALNSGGTQCVTEIDGLTTGVQISGGLRFRKVHAALYVEQSAGTSHKFGWRGNLQSRRATSGTGSTWADFGSTWSDNDNTLSGVASGAAQYVYQSDPETIPPLALQVRLQYIPRGFIATSEAFSSATGGVADVAPVLVLSDPNRLPSDVPV